MIRDKYGRRWDLPKNELCPVCKQPDSCGDCNHKSLTDEQAVSIGGILGKPRKSAVKPGKARTATTMAYRFGGGIAVDRFGPAGTTKVFYLFAYNPVRHDLSLMSATRFRRKTTRHRYWKIEATLFDGARKNLLARVPMHAETLSAARDLFVSNMTVAGFSE